MLVAVYFYPSIERRILSVLYPAGHEKAHIVVIQWVLRFMAVRDYPEPSAGLKRRNIT